MDPAQGKMLIEVIASLVMAIAIIAVIVNRITLKKGLSVRSIQFLAIGMVLPLILVLALEGILERSAVGALVGALIGYLFTNIGKYDERKAGKDEDA